MGWLIIGFRNGDFWSSVSNPSASTILKHLKFSNFSQWDGSLFSKKNHDFIRDKDESGVSRLRGIFCDNSQSGQRCNRECPKLHTNRKGLELHTCGAVRRSPPKTSQDSSSSEFLEVPTPTTSIDNFNTIPSCHSDS